MVDIIYYVNKLNNECTSKNKQFGQIKWELNDLSFNDSDDEPHKIENFRTYCYQSYSTYSLCNACTNTLEIYIREIDSTIYIERRLKKIEEFLKNHLNFDP